MYKAVFFDFDGVLVNTVAMSFAVSERLHPGLTKAEYARKHEGNVFSFFRSAAYSIEAFFAEYQHGLRTHEVTPELRALVKTSAERYPLAIISSSPSHLIDEYLKSVGLREQFALILGGDVHPNKTVKLLQACRALSCTPAEALFITDTLGDVREANEAVVPVVGVSWGVHSAEVLQRGAVRGVAHTADELLAFIMESP
jgi:phosphoglycolate phosphatase